jgi:hypothetical protein
VSTFFEAIRGGFSIYLGPDANNVPSVRFCLARFGEDPDLVLKTFWKEVGAGDFEIVPLYSHGAAPRLELCSQRSLAAALQTVTPEPSSYAEMQWKQVAQALDVQWPARLTPKKPEGRLAMVSPRNAEPNSP